MNVKRIISMAGAMFIGSLGMFPLSSPAQSTFQNLNFEQANPVSAGVSGEPWLVTVASALPFWTVYYGFSGQANMSFDGVSTGESLVTLVDSANPLPSPISGEYSVLLQGIGPGTIASISQTGLIPEGTESLLFEAAPVLGAPGPLEVEVGTQALSFAPMATAPNYTLYGADISEWAGQTEELTFSAPGGSYNNWEIDDISFSTEAVPEPNTVELGAVAAVLLGLRMWRKIGNLTAR